MLCSLYIHYVDVVEVEEVDLGFLNFDPAAILAQYVTRPTIHQVMLLIQEVGLAHLQPLHPLNRVILPTRRFLRRNHTRSFQLF